LHDDGKTGGILNSWRQYAKSGDIIFDVAGGLGGGVALRASSKVVGKFVKSIKEAKVPISITFKYSCLFIKYFNFLRQLTTRQLLKISHNLPVTRPFKNFSTTTFWQYG
jgi:NAD/NADP transhydrogenase alpha subunit